MMKKLIIGNWKMNPTTLKEAVKLAKASDKNGTVIAPPFVFIEEVAKVLKKATLGAQDLKISPEESKRLGVKYVIIGHSDRRALGETDAMIAKKLKIAVAQGLKAILCIGEPKRESGIKNNELREAKRYIKNQLKKDLVGIHNSKFIIQNSLIIAYEPIWAIGTGQNDAPADVSEIARFIKQSIFKSHKLKARVLYGGSVNAKDAKLFLETRNINGLLIGGASLKPKEFNKIIKNA